MMLLSTQFRDSTHFQRAHNTTDILPYGQNKYLLENKNVLTNDTIFLIVWDTQISPKLFCTLDRIMINSENYIPLY